MGVNVHWCSFYSITFFQYLMTNPQMFGVFSRPCRPAFILEPKEKKKVHKRLLTVQAYHCGIQSQALGVGPK
jgi:hypothetical protein